MFIAMTRSVGAVGAGLLAAMVLIVGIEGISSILHPFPPGVDPTDLEACKAHVARFPAWILLLAMAAWGTTTFVGSWLATRLGTRRHPAHGIVIGTILLAAVVFNMAMLPYPIWFWSNVVVFPVCCAWGIKLARAPTPP
jgi:hypothetical protein